MTTKFTLIISLFLLLGLKTLIAQDVIVKWNFPATSADAVLDEYNGFNSGKYLSCEHGVYNTPGYYAFTLDFTTDGAEVPTVSNDKCASVAGVNDGADSIYWMIKFKSEGFHNLKLYSKQFSSIAPAGPRDFKVQFKTSTQTNFTDIATITCSNDWTSGEVNGVSLPSSLDNLANNAITIRWIMTSNIGVAGDSVTNLGITKIDDIIITGEIVDGMEDMISKNQIKIFPNPSEGDISIENLHNMKDIKILDIVGNCVYSEANISDKTINVSHLSKGIYIVQISSMDEEIFIQKLIIE
jgi:hypothetical protein